jgi:hypothetical protein
VAEPATPRTERLLDAIFHDPRHEIVHEADCFGCSLAFEVVGTIAPLWDPLNNWDEIEAPQDKALPGDTLYRQLERITAYVLHRKLPGHKPAPGRPVVAR